MAMTYATITGKITRPGSNVGIRARVTATPMTTANALKFPAEDRVTWGPEVAETDSAGTLVALKIPTNHGMGELYWRIVAEPLDRIPGVSKWTLGTFTITASADLSDMVAIDTVAVDAQILVNLSDLVADAENARDDAEAAALVATDNANGFSIGTTTTGAAGSSAAASITGTAPNRLLNLTIPRGNTGAQGIQGIQGIQGPEGPAGRNVTSVTRTSGTGAPGTTDTYTIAFSDATSTTFQIYNGTDGVDGATGATGRGITTVVRTSGTGAPGTTDTYTITYSDATTSTFAVYNGANGTGAGNVVGPAAAVDSHVAAFDTASGKLIKDGGATVAQIRDRSTHTGTQSLDTTTDSATRVAMTPAERTKLGGVATGATANATDAQLRDRSTHTGTQAVSTVTGLATVATSGAYGDLSGKPTLGDAAAKNTGTTAGTVAAGDDSRITGALQTSAAPELIRDTIAAALVEGAGIDITVNDVGDTITIAATGGGGTSGAPIAYVATVDASPTSTTTTSTTGVVLDPDATVTFTPAGTEVDVIVEAPLSTTGTAGWVYLLLMNGATPITATTRGAIYTSSSVAVRVRCALRLTGLTPGVSVTRVLGWYTDSSITAVCFYGGNRGPITMEVYDR